MFDNCIKTAIIDDGVDEKFFDIGSLEYKVEITPHLKVVQLGDSHTKTIGHGTYCAAVIRKFAPHAALGSIKILNQQRRGVREQLVKALEWCIESGIRIINLSLGTVEYNDSFELRKIVNLAARKGVIIVSACSNKMIVTYPSYFSNVIGVKTDKRKKLKEGQYIYNHNADDGIDITCCSEFALEMGNGLTHWTEHCNSYATPFVTAKVIDILNENPDLTVEEVKLKLLEGSVNKEDKAQRPYLCKNTDWMENAAILRHGDGSSVLPCDLVQGDGSREQLGVKENKFYETVYETILTSDCFCNGAKNVKSILERCITNRIEFDTVILNGGNLDQKHAECTSEELIKAITDFGKNVVYLDDRELHRELNLPEPDNNIRIWHPSIFKNPDKAVLYKIDVPLVAFNDFTGCHMVELIKKLQECFRNEGYNTLSASDSCYGVVNGINYAPDGLKNLINIYNPDIILYGINAWDKGIDYLKNKNKPLKADISVIVSDEFSDNVKEFADIYGINDNHVIFLSHEKALCEEMQINRNMKAFCLSDSSCVNEIYKYIINLYDNQNGIQSDIIDTLS